jgi:hypothetical protein
MLGICSLELLVISFQYIEFLEEFIILCWFSLLWS